MDRICRWFSDLFVVWIVLVAAWSLSFSETFRWALPHIPWMLGLIMFGMGMTLSVADFKRILRRPLGIAIGCGAQYCVMPVLGYGIVHALGLPDVLGFGVILLGCCPGGTASNVITYLARGDVALSVSMTTVSTLLSPLLTPMLVLLLAGELMEIDGLALVFSIVKIVILPVFIGLAFNSFFGSKVSIIQPLLPVISILAILIIVGAIIGNESARILSVAGLLVLAVVIHNGGGLALGWLTSSMFGMTRSQRRAVSIEVGMQNSGLAAALAVAHFSPEAAVPAALFSVWHNISGPFLASFWTYLDRRKPQE